MNVFLFFEDARHVAIQEVNQYRETQGLHPLNGDPRVRSKQSFV